MNKSILDFLNKTTNTNTVNKLLVTSFIEHKEITKITNKEIKKLIIKNDSEEYSSLQEFTKILKNEKQKLCFEELLELFEFVISPSDKLINGAIYTPKDIRNYITKKCFKDYKTNSFNDVKIADISCGCGGFLINATSEIRKQTNNKSYKDIYKDNIFGIDIQKYSIERTKILLSLYAIYHGEDEEVFEFNLYAGDSLTYNWKAKHQIIDNNNGFDIILGNPPYVCSRNMNDETKKAMKSWNTCSSGHPDLYIPFFQIGFELLNTNGILGYITVNTFIKSFNGRAIRQYFQDKLIFLKIIDFEDEQIFNKRMTYTSICFLINKKSDKVLYIATKRHNLKNNLKYNEYNYSDLDVHKGWYFKNRKLVLELENAGRKLGDIYNTKSGIATLKNSVYIFKPAKIEEDYFYINDTVKIEKGICKDIINSNLLVKTNKIDSLMEKIIFPYEYNEEGQAHTIKEKDFKEKYPQAYMYLQDNKKLLLARDKGKGEHYKYWYAFGRNQSLLRTKYTLLFPQLAKQGFKSHISENQNLYFYNGMGALSNNLKELKTLQNIFSKKIFWIYISSISKYYASNYRSLGRNYIKDFGICDNNSYSNILKNFNID